MDHRQPAEDAGPARPAPVRDAITRWYEGARVDDAGPFVLFESCVAYDCRGTAYSSVFGRSGKLNHPLTFSRHSSKIS